MRQYKDNIFDVLIYIKCQKRIRKLSLLFLLMFYRPSQCFVGLYNILRETLRSEDAGVHLLWQEKEVSEPARWNYFNKQSSLTGGCKKRRRDTAASSHLCALWTEIQDSPKQNEEVSVMSNMLGLPDQYKVLISNWWKVSPHLTHWFMCGMNALHNMQHLEFIRTVVKLQLHQSCIKTITSLTIFFKTTVSIIC